MSRYYHGPPSDHFDGVRFFDPRGAPPRRRRDLLRWFVDRQATALGIKIELISSLDDKRVAPELETACFRIVQEALTNVARHARAGSVRIELTRNSTALLLSIRDDGTGFDVAAAHQRATTGGSFGLLGMEERVRPLGGYFEIDSSTSARLGDFRGSRS